MSDPFNNPPGTNPPRHVRPANATVWTIVAIATAVMLGVVLWEVNNREDRSARSELNSTVGRSERAPIPLPVNPNTTRPQPEARPDPVRPAQQ